MRLERITNRFPADCTQESHEIKSYPDQAELRTRFKDFGGHHSTFDVYLCWDDIERAIEQFAAQGAAGALRIQKAIRLAEAVAEISS